ncbi:uncharacterized protein ACNS7B_011467 [Menidia menidia]
MYPVQSMRKFVCDRLTAAAQEILGAFEKRVEDYETEIVRQRRLLDTVFASETKLHRTDLASCSNEDRDLLSQLQRGIGAPGSIPFSPHTLRVKDEHEEVSISQETSASKPIPTNDPTVSRDPPRQDLDPSAKDNPPSGAPNTGGDTGPDRDASAVSPANNGYQLLSQGFCESENQYFPTFHKEHVESLQNEESEASTCRSELTQQEGRSAVPEPNEVRGIEAKGAEQGHDESTTEPAPIRKQTSGNMTAMETASFDSMPNTECKGQPRATETTEEGRPASPRMVHPVTPDESPQCSYNALTPNDIPNSAGIAEPASYQGAQNVRPEENGDDDTSVIYIELTPVTEIVEPGPAPKKRKDKKRSKDKSKASATNQRSNEGKAKTGEMTDFSAHRKCDDGEMTSERASGPTAMSQSKDGKASSSSFETGLYETDQEESSESEGYIPVSPYDDPAAGSPEPIQGESTISNESTDQAAATIAQEESNASSSSRPVQDEMHSHGVVTCPENIEASSKNLSEKMADRSKAAPWKGARDGKRATSGSKERRKSRDLSPTSTTGRKRSREDAASGSKETTSLPDKATGDLASSEASSPGHKKKCKDKKTSGTDERLKQPDEGEASNEAPGLAQRQSEQNSSDEDAEEEENPFKCDRCGKVMTNFKNYKFHMKSHTVERTFKCDTCGKMFRESWELNKHLTVHSEVKPFKCDVCGHGFNRRYNLDLHARVHTGEKPYKCSTCNKTFSACVNMKKHMRIHTGEKPYNCKVCGKEFADSSAFKNHVRVHTGEKPFKCTYCNRKFTINTTLRRHLRTHTGEKPYQCNVCHKKFGHRTDLKGHIRTHTGEKPYECNSCDQCFSTWTKLNKHKSVHSSDVQSSTD